VNYLLIVLRKEKATEQSWQRRNELREGELKAHIKHPNLRI
jgi:hypothetical protein